MRADESYIQDIKAGSNNILVAVRVRPLSQKELSVIDLDTVKVLDSKIVVLLDPENEFSKDVSTCRYLRCSRKTALRI